MKYKFLKIVVLAVLVVSSFFVGRGAIAASSSDLVTNAYYLNYFTTPIFPTNTTINTPTVFSAYVSNVGVGVTSGSFSNFFQVASSSNGGGVIIDLSSTLMSALSPGSLNKTSQSYTFTSPGTYSMRACADKSNSSDVGLVTESNEGNNCGPWINIEANPAGVLPNLTAGYVTPTTATLNTATELFSTISNTGNASTNASFYSYFQVATAPRGGGAITNVTFSSITNLTSLSAGASDVYSHYYTFPSVGTYSARACVDQNHSLNGSITESNENDNCGPWTDVVVGSIPPPSPTDLPDLTAGAVTPINVPINTKGVVFLSTISNTGNVYAESTEGANFSNFFQVSDTLNGKGNITNLTATLMSPIAPNSTVTATSAGFITPNSTNPYSVRACADLPPQPNGVVTESDEDNNCGPWTDINLTPYVAPKPDLTVGIASPTSALLNTSTNFSATVSNVGNASIAGSFSNLFQVATLPNGGGSITNITLSTMNGLTSDSIKQVTKSYTFSSTDTYSIRFCADLPPNNNGVIDESNEGNNCGPWTNVTVMTSCVAAQGNNCISSPNSCGQVNSGTISCAGTCSALPPLESSCVGVGGGTGTCSDGKQNGNETGVDTGGRCGDTGDGTCHDGLQNGNETGVDTGGRCVNTEDTSGTCYDGIKNGNEGPAADEGGRCTNPGVGNCFDKVKNGNETGVDTGGRCGQKKPIFIEN